MTAMQVIYIGADVLLVVAGSFLLVVLYIGLRIMVAAFGKKSDISKAISTQRKQLSRQVLDEDGNVLPGLAYNSKGKVVRIY